MPIGWGALIGGGLSLVGNLLGGSSSPNSATQTVRNQIDPNIVPYLYGDGTGGLLGNVAALYNQQMQTGGLNPLQTSGLELQRQALMDPDYTKGLTQMRNLGSGLLSQGVAGNPFTGSQTAVGIPSLGQIPAGRMVAGGDGGLITSNGPQYAPGPSSLLSAAYSPIQAQQIPPLTKPLAPQAPAAPSSGPAPGSWDWTQQLRDEVLAGK